MSSLIKKTEKPKEQHRHKWEQHGCALYCECGAIKDAPLPPKIVHGQPVENRQVFSADFWDAWEALTVPDSIESVFPAKKWAAKNGAWKIVKRAINAIKVIDQP